MKVAIVGVTGLVGRKLLHLIERHMTNVELIPVASSKSVGTYIKYNNKNYLISDIETLLEKNPRLVFMTCGNEISKKWAPIFSENNIWVIDNSSQFRLDSNIPLVIPEINANIINSNTKLIANPNCSTAQLAMVLYPLHIKYKIKRVVVSTYQSVSGAGEAGVKQLIDERNKISIISLLDSRVFPMNIDLNCIALCDKMDNETGYTGEELKLERETPKILDSDIKVTATAVRVPVIGGHSESVNIEFYNDFEIDEVIKILKNMSGVEVKHNTNYLLYNVAAPYNVQDKEEVWVDRIRRDYSQNNTLNLWIVADNLMKGAALNAVQIANYLYTSGLLDN